MSAIQEFLTANVQRRFPFVENCPLTAADTTQLSDGVILDAHGFFRERPELAPQLTAIAGGTSGVDGAVAGHHLLIFSMGRTDAPLTFSFLVDDSTTDWPLRMKASVADPFYPASLLGRLDIAVGETILGIPDATSLVFNGTALLEPSVVANLYRTQIDFVRIVHADDDDEIVGGNLQIEQGYNMEVQRTRGGVMLAPSLGAGLGRFTGSISPASTHCSGAVMSINGQSPNKQGRFIVRGTNGIEVVNLPEQHKIQLRVQTAKLGPVCDV